MSTRPRPAVAAGSPDTAVRYGSDVIVALLTQLGIEYAAFNPGATFRGIHDSLVNNRPAPNIIECCHEEISVAIAHGYAKAAGRPMVACVHNVVGLQHASMAIFNAWCDNVPVLVLGGTGPRDITRRRPQVDWIHTALVQGTLVRDFVKWDDEPINLASVPESLARGYRTAVSRPYGPVYINFDVLIQEDPIPDGYRVPDLSRYAAAPPPTAPQDELERVARALADAEHPVIITDRSERPDAVAALAEALGAPVLDRANRVGIPNEHPLDLTGADAEVLESADFILGLEADDLFGALHRRTPQHGEPIPLTQPDACVAHIGLRELALRAWVTDVQRLTRIDIPLVGDAGAAAVQLTSLVADRIPAERRRARLHAARTRHDALRAAWRDEAARHRDANGPVHPAALASIVWEAIRQDDFCLANDSSHGWARRIWNIERTDQHLGLNGGGGLGFGPGGSIGATLALARHGRLVVDVQADGDLLFTPASLWTLAKYQLPLLIVMDNNRSYYNSQNHARDVAQHRHRPVENWVVGTAIGDPRVDFPGLARAFGIWAEGPVERASDLPLVLARALAVVKSGRPALVDVATVPLLG